MFEAVELGQSLAKADFKEKEPRIREQLLKLQFELKQANIATLIIVAGVEGAGKGEVVDRLIKWFDSRGMETHAFWDETDEELRRPHHWRYWKRLPARGDIAVMFGGWYWDPLHERAADITSDNQLDETTRRIKELERALSMDGLLIIKLWFHLSHRTHEKRMKKRREVSKHVRSHVGNGKNLDQYTQFLTAAERILRQTDTGDCPWHLIEADDKWFRDMSIAELLCTRMSQRIKHQPVSQNAQQDSTSIFLSEDSSLTVLDKIDLSKTLTKDEYNTQLELYQSKLQELAWKAYDQKRSTVIVFEGWDAAGKGGSIRRLTDAMDARLFRVMSFAAPTDEERARHYLWRFWRQVPRDGYMRIYDRSWYGRVLVERVENFAQHHEWKHAYEEINNFEEQLAVHGTVIIKFWMHISKEEQLNRFMEREKTPWKQHKLTEEDWRNREKWEDYKQVVNAMITRTSTSIAPWILIPAENKYYARVEVVKSVCKKLQSMLKD